MKKSIVVLLLVLAVVVLVSPGIVGRLAEKSMDENLDWAADESEELVVTSQGFDRGWFSSEGQHRVEIRDGELHDALLTLAAGRGVMELPTLIIDTRLDHGIVPLTSMTRDKGSLRPGLGSAVSKLTLEFDDGEQLELPGTVYSEVGLTGNLRSNLILEAGTFTDQDSTARWGDTDIIVTTDPAGRTVGFSGEISSLALLSHGSGVSVDRITFEGDQRPTRFGFAVGEIAVNVSSLDIPSAGGAQTIGPIDLSSDLALDGERVSGHSSVRLDNLVFPEFGPGGVAIDATLTGMDAAALGNLTRALEDYTSFASGDEMMLAMDADLRRLLASGFELRFDQIDITLPQGTMKTRLDLELAETDLDGFAWTSALMALDASLDLSIPAELVDLAIAADPQFNAAVGMGFLKPDGDTYRMEAMFRKGLLTVNGAPMPLPFPGMQ